MENEMILMFVQKCTEPLYGRGIADIYGKMNIVEKLTCIF